VIGKTIAEIGPGDHAALVRLVEEDDIASFIDAVGDLNPVHSDAAYAATTPFKGPIAPGIFTAGLISAVIGTRLPGPGAAYLSQSLKFVKPVRAGTRSLPRWTSSRCSASAIASGSRPYVSTSAARRFSRARRG